MSSFRTLAVLGGLALLPTVAAAEEQPDIRLTIERQLEAFRSNDSVAAFALAAPQIQASFGSPDRFLGMVKDGYTPVFRAKSVMFGKLVHNEEGATLQLVHLVDDRNRPWLALYIMEAQDDGTWRIGGCLLTTDPGADV